MRVEIDTHTHTLASGHAYNTMNEMAKAAADKGLKGLAITEQDRKSTRLNSSHPSSSRMPSSA